ncbi:MAG: App1 family protein [Bacteroidota bacterium]
MLFWNKFLKWIGKLDLIQIEAFLAFSNGKEVFVKGRVISAYKQSRPKEKNNPFTNILASIRRYAVTTLPEVEVDILLGEIQKRVTTDQEGVFECLLPFKESEKVNISVHSREQGLKYKDASLAVHRVRCKNGVISDIDDTILISNATEIGKKFWLSVSKNAYTRRPFPGVSAFYQKLQRSGENEVFYVSSGDWSLFDLIQDFLRFRGIPKGPILLKDKHINLKNIWKSGGGSHDHKLEKIRFLFSFFPEIKFILIGDSGQHDPEIYAQIIEEFPERVRMVIIREIRSKNISRTSREDIKADPKFFFVQSTEEAMQVAENLNLFIP